MLALQAAAAAELADGPFADGRLTACVVARGLAGAIDHLAGGTYLEWFRNRREVAIEEGKPYPVSHHDPRPWLGSNAANTNPVNLSFRHLDQTLRLKIAKQQAGFRYVIDFGLWNRLSPLGSGDDLVVAVGQPNLHLGEFDIHCFIGTPRSIANYGPNLSDDQIQRITKLVDAAMAESAQVVLLPEYSLSDTVSTKLTERLAQLDKPPMVFCAGIAGESDADGYVENESWLLVNTPGMDPSWSQRSNAKTTSAALGGVHERIRTASEVRVFASARWTVGVLVCVEAMNDEIISQLSDLGTNLLLVPAMSEKTATMVGAVRTVCHRSQGFVALANGPASWEYRIPDTGSLVSDSAASGSGAETREQGTDSSSRPNSSGQRCEAFFAGPYGAAGQGSWCLPNEGNGRPADDLVLWVFRSARPSVEEHVLTQ